jgi:hypothetical protein
MVNHHSEREESMPKKEKSSKKTVKISDLTVKKGSAVKGGVARRTSTS